MQLRPYQQKAIDDVRAAYSAGHRSVLLQMPTGAGKTAVMAHAADGVSRKGRTSAIIAHRQELILQTSLTLARQGIWHGMVAPENVMREAVRSQLHEYGRSFFNNDAPVKVCSVQTMARREYDPFGFLFWDECHHCTSGSYKKVFDLHANAWHMGVTATPERLDGKGLGRDFGGCFDAMVEGPNTRELMDDGYLCDAEVWGPPQQLDFSDIRTVAGDFDRTATAGLVDKPTITGDAIAHYRRLADRQPAIAFCINIEHAQHVAEQFRAAGYRAQCVDGTMSDFDRRQAINNLATGRLDVLTSCEIINEGTDVPVVSVGILLRPTQSLGLHLQQIGRVLRPVYARGFDLGTRDGRLQAIAMGTKPRAIILDHVGNCAKHGMADDPREWTLEGRRKKARGASTAAPAARQCKQCYAIYRAQMQRCPACGTAAEPTEREIEYREGELVKIQRDEAERLKKEEYWRQRKAQHAAESQEELVKVFLGQGMAYPKAIARARYIINARAAKAGGSTTPQLV